MTAGESSALNGGSIIFKESSCTLYSGGALDIVSGKNFQCGNVMVHSASSLTPSNSSGNIAVITGCNAG